MVEKVVLGATVAPPPALPDGLLAAVREACADPAVRAALAGELKELRTKLPGELFITPDLAPFDPEALDEVLDDAAAAALAFLCGGERV